MFVATHEQRPALQRPALQQRLQYYLLYVYMQHICTAYNSIQYTVYTVYISHNLCTTFRSNAAWSTFYKSLQCLQWGNIFSGTAAETYTHVVDGATAQLTHLRVLRLAMGGPTSGSQGGKLNIHLFTPLPAQKRHAWTSISTTPATIHARTVHGTEKQMASQNWLLSECHNKSNKFQHVVFSIAILCSAVLYSTVLYIL